MQALLPILSKKFLTPMDLRRMQELLLRMRMVCNSTYLIDRNTHISPKLDELRTSSTNWWCRTTARWSFSASGPP